MRLKKSFKNFTALFLAVIVFALLLFDPKTAKTGVFSGLLLCGRVIIPSLFMFSFVVIFSNKSSVASNFVFLNKISLKLLGLDFYEFYIFLLSLIGGYPIGVKLLNEAVKEKNMDKNRAEELSLFFISSGPGFTVSVIGETIFKSRQIGYILFISQLLSAVVLCRLFIKKSNTNKIYNFKPYKLSDCFVKSVFEASQTLINVSSFVIFFSFLTEYFIKYKNYLSLFKFMPYFLEITNAVNLTNNIYLISFLLGFSGISVICQVISIADSFRINALKLFALRLVTGAVSCAFTKLLMRVFKVSVVTISTNKSFIRKEYFDSKAVAISLFVTLIVFMISIVSKKYAGKIKDDMV